MSNGAQHQHVPSLVRYGTEPPNLDELEASTWGPGSYEAPSRAIFQYVEDNISLIISGLLLLLLFYVARPQVPDARFRGRFRRQMRELKEALAEKPAEREERIQDALVVQVGTCKCR